jgi:hypothetical protein
VAGKRGGGLVHYEEAGVGGHGAADRDELAVGDGEICELGVEVERHADPRHRLAGHLLHLGPVDEARRSEVAADRDVFRDGQVRE